jgi:hypothetical protein
LLPLHRGPAPASKALSATCTVARSRPELDALEGEWNDFLRRSGKSHQLFQAFMGVRSARPTAVDSAAPQALIQVIR